MGFSTLEDFLNTYKLSNTGLPNVSYHTPVQQSYELFPTTNYFANPNYTHAHLTKDYWKKDSTENIKTKYIPTKQTFMYSQQEPMNYE